MNGKFYKVNIANRKMKMTRNKRSPEDIELACFIRSI